jgi:hypothetical protein
MASVFSKQGRGTNFGENVSGWIRAHRALSDHDLWLSEKFTRGQAWMDLLLIANWRPGRILKRGIWVDLKPGQIGWSLESLAKRWRWSKGRVMRYLNELQTDTQIELQKNNVTTVITITNWGKYQPDGIADEQTDDTASATANRTADGTVSKKLSTSVDSKKGKKKEKESVPEAVQELLDDFGFTAAWESWERYRVELKKKLTPSTKKSQLKNLAKYSPAVAIKAIDKSIEHGWTGLFPEKIEEQPKRFSIDNDPDLAEFTEGSSEGRCDLGI